MVVAVSHLIISLTVGQFELCISATAGISDLLLVTILAARFCKFCRVCSLVAAQHPYTEQQHRKLTCTITRYTLLNVFCGKNLMAYFKNPIGRETLVWRISMCSSHLKLLSIITPRYFVLSTFST